nr:PAS domain S-box protein [Chloroflexota bacterium]
MEDEQKTKEQFISELAGLRQRVAELEAADTERVRTEEQLRRSEERYRALYESSRDGIVAANLDGLITECNQPYAEMLGYSREELKRFRCQEITPSKWYAFNEDVFREVMERGYSYEFEQEYIRKDGTVFPISLRTWRIDDEAGNPIGVYSVVRDITERKRAEEALRRAHDELEARVQERTAELAKANEALRAEITERNRAEEALRESEERLRGLFETMAEGVIAIAPDGQIVQANPAAERILGLKRTEIEGRNYVAPEWEILRPDETSMPAEEMAGPQAMKEKRLVKDVVMGTKRPDGSISWINVSAAPLINEAGELEGVVGTFADITERKQAEEVLAHERDLLQALMDNIPDTIYFKDAASRFTRINRAQAQVLGLNDPKEAIGKTDFDFFTPEHARGAYADEQEIVKSGQPLIDKVERIRRADGHIRWVSATKVPIMDQKGRVTGIVGISRDITERKRAEEERERLLVAEHEQRLLAETLAEVALTLTSQTSHSAVLDEILRQAQRIVPCNTANIALLEGDTLRVACWQGYEAFGAEEMISGLVQSLDDLTSDAEVVHSRKPMVIPDTHQDPRWAVFDETAWIRSYLVVPICLRDRVLGLLRLDSDTLGAFSAEDAKRLQPLGNAAAIALENARLFEAERERSTQLGAVAKVAERIASILNLDELLRETVELITQTFGYYYAAIMLLDAEANELVFNVGAGGYAGRTPAGFRQKVKEGMIGWAAHLGKTVWANDVSQEPRYIPAYLSETRSELDVPLKYHDRVIGVLDLQSKELNAFTQHDVMAMETLAGHVAAAIENARLYEETQQRALEQETLREAALALTTALDRNEVIDRILAQLQRVAPYDSASVQLLQGDRLVIIGGRGFPNLPDLLGISFSTDGDNPNSEVIRTQSPFIVEDAPSMYEAFREDPHQQSDIRSWLGVPLLVGERLVGMIALDKREPGFYTQQHARLAEAFAAQAAIAIENARLFEEIEERRLYLEGVLGAAPDAIVTLDAQHRIVEWNPGAEKLFGYSQEEVVGQDIDDLITSPEVLEEAVEFTQVAMGGMEVPPTEAVRCRKDGSPVDVLLAGSPIMVGDELIGTVAVYTDITARVRMEETLR